MAAACRIAARLGAALLAACLVWAPARAQPQPAPANQAARPAEPVRRLPADSITKHTLELPGRTLHFTATTGSVTLSDAAGVPQAQIGVIAYTLDGADPARRPVSFALNGGPGSASAWLQLGALGPWRMRMTPEAARPSATPATVDNADTWLDFTDLVFIDPIGTGFSKLLVNSDENRKRYWSVGGDVASLAEAMRLWLEAAHRLASPKYLIGESYSGLRGPRLVREATQAQGIGFTGLVLISPKMDYGGRSLALDPMQWIGVLPTAVASMRALKGPVTHAQMKDVEDYATGDYAADLIRGEAPDALRRRIDRLAELTGLDRALLERRHGKISNFEFLREREPGQVGSAYDATVTKADPFPENAQTFHPDALTDALSAPFTSAMLDIYQRRLNWLPDGHYLMTNFNVLQAWDFGTSPYRPESVTYLRQALAADPGLHVLIAHGLFDFVTPYFETKMQLDQIPRSVATDRIRLVVYPGGHMFYSRDESRQQFRNAALALYTQP